MPSGRTRQFEVDEALDRALEVFWARGYEGATLPELTQAMGINRPSLYAAFGNKQSLFRKAMERYEQGPAAYVRRALEEPTARRVPPIRPAVARPVLAAEWDRRIRQGGRASPVEQPASAEALRRAG